jgi:hypothetical protein
METRNLFLKLIVGFTFLSFFMISCDKGNTPIAQSTDPIVTEVGTVAGEENSSSIGSSGGSITSEDGNLTVIIPSGALSTETNISVLPITNEAPLGLGNGYRLEPEGTTFSKPIRLTFHFNDQLLKGTLPDFLWIVSQTTDGSWNAMLKSTVDPVAKTVTIETSHFSDWALGRFIDLSLNPTSTTIQKGQSVQLKLYGFARGSDLQDDDDLAPLIPVNGEDLTPLTPIPPVESRLMSFKIKKWTLNGSAAPVSNGNGSLNVSNDGAIYKAPDQKPTKNPVTISVELETRYNDQSMGSYILSSLIMVVSDYYVNLKIDGKTYEYIQYGHNTSTPPDPDNFSLVACGMSDGWFELLASMLNSTSGPKDILELKFDNPSKSTRSLVGSNSEGTDVLSFIPLQGISSYELNYTKRTSISDNTCDRKYLCGNGSVTLTTFGNKPGDGYFSEVGGYFSGTIYSDKSDYDNNCISSDEHTIEGEFWLMMLN